METTELDSELIWLESDSVVVKAVGSELCSELISVESELLTGMKLF